MSPGDAGFLLLTSHLGDPDRKPLTVAQFRMLTQRARAMEMPMEDRALTVKDLMGLGYGREMAQRILDLLREEERLEYYVRKGERVGCTPITRMSPVYPQLLRKRLGMDCPGCLWAKGDLSLLGRPGVALVGSRDLGDANRVFARQVGFQAARQNFVLISGNAKGADQEAQNACLEAGGRVISTVADELNSHGPDERVLYLSEDSFDAPFSPQRALSRNRVIHTLGQLTFVAQSSLQQGGSWDGTVKNLRFGWSQVFCFDDGTAAAAQLGLMGATLVGIEELGNFDMLHDNIKNLFDQ